MMKKCRFYIYLVILLAANVSLFYFCYPYLRWKYNDIAKRFDALDVKIFVTYYKPFRIPDKGHILQPIQVGRAIEKDPFMGGQLSDEDVEWLHKRMIGDNTGENISEKNRSFDVLTAYYWVWKNYRKIGNPKYIGFFAHRKLLELGASEYQKFSIYAPDYGYTARGLKALLKKHRIIAHRSKPWYGSVYNHYRYDHHVEDIDMMIEIIRRDYPEMVGAMMNVLHAQNQPYAIWNFWMMEKELAFDYFQKLFHIMFEIEDRRGAVIAQYNLYQRRVFGYLAERFYAIWLEYQMKDNGLDPLFVPVLLVVK